LDNSTEMAKNIFTITHLTSAHQRYDTRIFIKMCRSLSLNGYNVSLVVADGKGDEVKNGLSIIDGTPQVVVKKKFDI
jgi:hypothetical protein